MAISYYDKPILIGIAGGSGSGKTTLSNSIYNKLSEKTLRGYIISIDDFYISTTDNEKEQIKDIDFDDPKRIEFNELESVLKNITKREKIIIPTYDFKSCKRIGKKELDCSYIDFVIVEGLFCLYHSNIRNLLDISLFIEISDDLRWQRRVQRDVIERGANINDLVSYYNKFVKPSYNIHILPTIKYADKIIDESDNEYKLSINWIISKLLV